MPNCVHCGARHEDTSGGACPRCGTPHEDTAPQNTVPQDAVPKDTLPGGGGQGLGPVGSRYVRVGSTILPLWLLWLLAVLLVGGGLTAYFLPRASSGPSYDSAVTVPSFTPPPTPDTDPLPPPTDDLFPPPLDPSPTAEEASAVVEEFYQDINDRDFEAAWELGGKNIGGSDYSQWVSGYDTTKSIEVTAVDSGADGEVSATILATQDDDSVRTYQGTYTVSDGEIVKADITEA